MCDHPDVPTDTTNLAWQAADVVARDAGLALEGLELRLVKQVPAQAGLGGGSSDAVAAARLCLAAWGRRMDPARLAALLAPLGADVAFFVEGGTRRGSGRGDALASVVAPPAMHVVIVRPSFGVSTSDAYRWYDDQRLPAPGTRSRVPESASEWTETWAARHNDLQDPVVARHPEIGWALARLRSRGAEVALLSGSGSACFGLFEHQQGAVAAASDWPDGWMAWHSHTLDAGQYREATMPRRVP
jgi:4-diphosphocytidyl-2-C-methyl-D-erythritol kinase